MASVGWKWTPVKLSQLRLSWVRFGWVRRFFSIWIKYTRNGCRSMGATNQIWASCRVSFFLSFAFDVEESGGPRLETFAAATFTIGLRAAPFATESIALAMKKKGQKKKKKKKKKKKLFRGYKCSSQMLLSVEVQATRFPRRFSFIFFFFVKCCRCRSEW